MAMSSTSANAARPVAFNMMSSGSASSPANPVSPGRFPSEPPANRTVVLGAPVVPTRPASSEIGLAAVAPES